MPWVPAIRRRVLDACGGGDRARVVALLACVLALETADTSAIGAAAGELQRALGLSHTDVGLLATSGLVVAAVCALPVGQVVDRVDRVRLLVGSILLWSLGLVVVGASSSFAMLLVARMAVGAIAATAWPAVASLIGDLFARGERSRIYGLILGGELLGTGAGFLLSGNVAMATSWRFGFWVLIAPGVALAILLARRLDEPARGGAGRLPANPVDGARRGHPNPGEDVQPREALLLAEDPMRMPLRRAARYVLRIPTNLVLVAASTLGYFFLGGARTFGVEYLRTHFGLSQALLTLMLVAVGAGALMGVLSGGRIADRLIARGHPNGRVVVGGIAYLAAAALFVPGIALPLGFAVPALCGATFALRAAAPPLDGARLDVMHHRLWGRAEGVRTLARTSLQAAAPVTFGAAADLFGGTRVGAGLQGALLVMLVPLAISGAVVLLALRTYPRDVATAAASERRLIGPSPAPPAAPRGRARASSRRRGAGVPGRAPAE